MLELEVADSYAGALLVRSRRLDGAATMSFGTPGGDGLQPSAILHVPVHRGEADVQVVASSPAGCWAVAVDGYRVSEVFLVNLR